MPRNCQSRVSPTYGILNSFRSIGGLDLPRLLRNNQVLESGSGRHWESNLSEAETRSVVTEFVTHRLLATGLERRAIYRFSAACPAKRQNSIPARGAEATARSASEIASHCQVRRESRCRGPLMKFNGARAAPRSTYTNCLRLLPGCRGASPGSQKASTPHGRSSLDRLVRRPFLP